MFSTILSIINNGEDKNFDDTCRRLEKCINSGKNFIDTLRQIEIIPESIPHDSTAEKLFAKASDLALSRAFNELGLKSVVVRERSDSADILAESRLFGYSLVSDAKVFRLSRTAKNQKDFKVSALSGWRKDNDFAVLCAPYFQYPARNSQIYSQAIMNNVCLLSWEHLIFFIENGIKESAAVNLSALWNFCDNFSKQVLVSDMKKNFLPELNRFLARLVNIDSNNLYSSFREQKQRIITRSSEEKSYWLDRIQQIRQYSREQAVNELITSLKIHEKLNHIDAYIRSLSS